MKEHATVELAQIVGPENVTRDEKKLSAYFRVPLPAVPLLAVCPKELEQVIELVKYAAKNAVPVFTLKDSAFSVPPPDSGGIILDFRHMNAIERVDARNLTAHIQRGVTWDQLDQELGRHGVKTLLPAAATSPYVLDTMVCRVIMRSAVRYPEVQVANLKVVLADGRVHLTGSHALSEDGCDSKDDGGPNISRWYIGAEDMYGIPVRASIWIYPLPQAQDFLFFGFEALAPALTAIRNIPRKEVCDQALVMNGHYLAMLTRDTPVNPPPWLVILGCEGKASHIAFQAGVCRQDAAALGGKELLGLNEQLAAVLHRPWYRPPYSHGFYTFISRVQEFRDAVGPQLRGPMAELYVSHGYGRAAWCEFDYIEPYPDRLAQTFDKVNDLLVQRGAYFDRPLGRLAERFYAGNPSYLNQIKRVKQIVDPQRILNPDQLLMGV